MPKSYLEYLRWRIVFIGQPARETHFPSGKRNVSNSTVERFLHRYYTNGEVRAAQEHSHDRLLDDFEQLTILSQQARYLLERSTGGAV